MEELFAARIQMAFTLGFHIILACFGVGLPVLMLAAEAKYLQAKDAIYKTLAQRWSIMRTKDAVTDAPGINLIFFTTLLIYAILFIGSVSVLRFLAKKPIEA